MDDIINEMLNASISEIKYKPITVEPDYKDDIDDKYSVDNSLAIEYSNNYHCDETQIIHVGKFYKAIGDNLNTYFKLLLNNDNDTTFINDNL